MCDLPEITFKSMLDYIKNTIKPDIIFWTGDNSPHDIWEITPDEDKNSTRLVTELLMSYFNNTNTAIYPV